MTKQNSVSPAVSPQTKGGLQDMGKVPGLKAKNAAMLIAAHNSATATAKPGVITKTHTKMRTRIVSGKTVIETETTVTTVDAATGEETVNTTSEIRDAPTVVPVTEKTSPPIVASAALVAPVAPVATNQPKKSGWGKKIFRKLGRGKSRRSVQSKKAIPLLAAVPESSVQADCQVPDISKGKLVFVKRVDKPVSVKMGKPVLQGTSPALAATPISTQPRTPYLDNNIATDLGMECIIEQRQEQQLQQQHLQKRECKAEGNTVATSVEIQTTETFRNIPGKEIPAPVSQKKEHNAGGNAVATSVEIQTTKTNRNISGKETPTQKTKREDCKAECKTTSTFIEPQTAKTDRNISGTETPAHKTQKGECKLEGNIAATFVEPQTTKTAMNVLGKETPAHKTETFLVDVRELKENQVIVTQTTKTGMKVLSNESPAHKTETFEFDVREPIEDQVAVVQSAEAGVDTKDKPINEVPPREPAEPLQDEKQTFSVVSALTNEEEDGGDLPCTVSTNDSAMTHNDKTSLITDEIRGDSIAEQTVQAATPDELPSFIEDAIKVAVPAPVSMAKAPSLMGTPLKKTELAIDTPSAPEESTVLLPPPPMDTPIVVVVESSKEEAGADLQVHTNVSPRANAISKTVFEDATENSPTTTEIDSVHVPAPRTEKQNSIAMRAPEIIDVPEKIDDSVSFIEPETEEPAVVDELTRASETSEDSIMTALASATTTPVLFPSVGAPVVGTPVLGGRVPDAPIADIPLTTRSTLPFPVRLPTPAVITRDDYPVVAKAGEEKEKMDDSNIMKQLETSNEPSFEEVEKTGGPLGQDENNTEYEEITVIDDAIYEIVYFEDETLDSSNHSKSLDGSSHHNQNKLAPHLASKRSGPAPEKVTGGIKIQGMELLMANLQAKVATYN